MCGMLRGRAFRGVPEEEGVMDDLDKKIVRLRGMGLSFRAIARRMRRSSSTIRCRAKRLYSPSERVSEWNLCKFTPEEVSRLTDLHKSGMAYQDIADVMGKPFLQVREKIGRLRNQGLVEARLVRPRLTVTHAKVGSDWSAAEVMSAAVYDYVAANPGCESKDIADATGYGKHSCDRELWRLQRGPEPLVKRVRGRGWYVWNYVPQ